MWHGGLGSERSGVLGLRKRSSTPKIEKRHPLRWVLASSCLFVGVGVIWWAIDVRVSTYGDVAEQVLAERPYNELTGRAVDIAIDDSQSLFQMDLVLLAAVWALVIAKQDEAAIALGDWPELLMFTIANALLGLSFLWHWFFVGDVQTAFVVAGATCSTSDYQCIPDVFDDTVSRQLLFQKIFFAAGGISTALTLFSAHRLKEGKA